MILKTCPWNKDLRYSSLQCRSSGYSISIVGICFCLGRLWIKAMKHLACFCWVLQSRSPQPNLSRVLDQSSTPTAVPGQISSWTLVEKPKTTKGDKEHKVWPGTRYEWCTDLCKLQIFYQQLMITISKATGWFLRDPFFYVPSSRSRCASSWSNQNTSPTCWKRFILDNHCPNEKHRQAIGFHSLEQPTKQHDFWSWGWKLIPRLPKPLEDSWDIL